MTDEATMLIQLGISVGGTLIGGLLLALIFFLLNDFVFSLPTLSGLWSFQSETSLTSYNPYKEMKVTYLVLLWQEGHAIYGSGEKVRENVKGVIRTYTGEQRSRIEIRGHITKRFFKKSTVVLHFTEHGEKRQSSTMQNLRICDKAAMEGDYASTVANSSGTTRWTRGNNELKFEGIV
jgi:hypothetical protein